jgi:hypothetical protein
MKLENLWDSRERLLNRIFDRLQEIAEITQDEINVILEQAQLEMKGE